MPRRVVLFGANGRLGQALRSRFSEAGDVVAAIPWREASAWTEAKAVRNRIVTAVGEVGFDVIFAGGNTDPAQPSARLTADNMTFVITVIEALGAIPGTRFLIFGTILETFDEIVAVNRYAESKRTLATWVERAARGDLAGRIGHMRLHTLYGGGDPAPHMFTGQMLAALRARRPFSMSAGNQLREYHHVEDVAGAVWRRLERTELDPPVLTLSSGRPVRLADLARAIFDRLGRLEDLQIGALPTPTAENIDRVFEASPRWLLEPSRDPVGGVVTWMTARLNT